MAAMQTAMLGRLSYTVLRDAILTHPQWPKVESIIGQRSAMSQAPAVVVRDMPMAVHGLLPLTGRGFGFVIDR